MILSEIMNQKSNLPLFPTNFAFMDYYEKNYATIDPFIRIMYGGMKTIVDDSTTFDLFVEGYMTAQKEAIEKRYNVLRTPYNPIWNVDGTEVTEGENTQTGSISNLKSGDITSTRTGSITNGKNGSVLRENGVITTTTTTQKSPFESDGFVDDTKETANTDATTSAETYNNFSDNQTFNNVSDKQEFNNVSDKQTFDNVKNVSRETLTRKGNIGVTSTQNLISQELALRLNDFYMMLFSEIINTICYGWE